MAKLQMESMLVVLKEYEAEDECAAQVNLIPKYEPSPYTPATPINPLYPAATPINPLP